MQHTSGLMFLPHTQSQLWKAPESRMDFSPNKMIYIINELAEFLKILVSSACDIHITVYVLTWGLNLNNIGEVWSVDCGRKQLQLAQWKVCILHLLNCLIFNFTFSTKMYYNTILCKLMNTVPECQTSVWWCAPHLTVVCQCNASGRVRSLAMEHNRVRLQARNTAWW